jgi:ankyrin repeat protein
MLISLCIYVYQEKGDLLMKKIVLIFLSTALCVEFASIAMDTGPNDDITSDQDKNNMQQKRALQKLQKNQLNKLLIDELRIIPTNMSNIMRLIREGAHPNTFNKYGYHHTALHIAAAWGYANEVKELLQYGADPLQCTKDQMTALELARINNCQECVTILSNAIQSHH